MWLFTIILGIISVLVGKQGYKKGWFNSKSRNRIKNTIFKPTVVKNLLMGIGGFLILLGILSTSFVFVPTKHTGHLTKKFGSELKDGRVIAINGERGRQSRLLQEGLNFEPFIGVIYNIEFFEYEKIEEGKVGLLTAVDGIPMGKDLFIAPDWVPDSMEHKRDSIEISMLNPYNFIKNKGRKGPQLNVLKPGEYKINKYMWNVDIVDATRIPDGRVGVIISRVGKVPKDIELGALGNKLATPVVDKGYMGIWKEVLKPGMYYLNRHPNNNKGAYKVKIVDTRIQTWVYKGGYEYYTIDLTIGEDGKIKQTKSKIKTKEMPKGSADKAINCRSKDGWDVFVDGRILVQVQPIDAPYIIASVGGIEELENRVTTPLIRSVLRNISESREATTFVWQRSVIEKKSDSLLKAKSDGSRLTVKEFKMNDIYIKPELLVPDKREQLAKKMENTYKQEQKAYTEKVKTEKARQEAAQQGELVKAKIAKQAASEYKQAEYLKGLGKKLRMVEEAKGQKALTDVLGVDKTFKLEMTKIIKEYPDRAFQTPLFVGSGGGSGNDAYTAITIRQMISTMEKIGIDPAIINESVKGYNNVNTKVESNKNKETIEIK